MPMSFSLRACAVPADPSTPLAQREHPEPAHPYRSPFERDRARIIHARAFRRLAGKTQVFTHRNTPAFSDHFRSRLTHTMEVAQIARTVAATLGLNQDLAETLALVHDLGHPPFGHAGEQALDEALQRHGLRFDHNLHALRIVEHFEERYAGFRGLNLTLGVREGIIKHSHDYTRAEHPELAAYLLDQQPPLEAQIMDLADEIAYLTADLDDGIEAGLLPIEGMRGHVPLFERFYAPMAAEHTGAPQKLIFNEALKRMLNALVGDLIETTSREAVAQGISSLEEVRSAPRRLAAFSPEMEAERRDCKRYLYGHLYGSEELERDHQMARRVIDDLFTAWVREPSLLPASYASQVAAEGAPRAVADYLAGMTDPFILAQHTEWLAAQG
ncbi:MAG TPA: dNTP triphosphohydrolase [Acidobacteriaceae bacterium]